MANVALFHTGYLHLRLICLWYNLPGTPRGSRKKPKAGRSPTCRLWRPMLIYVYHAVPLLWPWEAVFRKAWYVWVNHGRTVLIKWERYNLNRHGLGTAWERHDMCESVLRLPDFVTSAPAVFNTMNIRVLIFRRWFDPGYMELSDARETIHSDTTGDRSRVLPTSRAVP
jgi:hypothetical protein